MFFLFYDGWNGQNCCQIKLGNKTMSCNSTYFLLLHGSLIKLLILSMSSIWKKEVNIVSAHHECDCTCYVHAIVHTLENKKKNRVQRNIGISHIVKPTCTTKIIHYIESYFKTLGINLILKSSHSIVPEILKENRSEKRSDTYQNAQ